MEIQPPAGEAGQDLPSAPEPSIQSGVCYAFFAYETAFSINLDRAEQRIHEITQRETIRHKRRAPSYFEYQPPPLRVTQDIEPLVLGNYPSRDSVDLIIYDFGAVSVIYSVPIHGALSDLLGLSEELYDNQVLLADSRRRVEKMLSVIGDAAAKANIADFVEDYVVFQIEALEPAFNAVELGAKHAQKIAQILRAERQPLSEQEVEDALSSKISFGSNDIAIVDWNASLLLDPEGDDIRAVLEFANVELVEMRYLDQKMDRALDQAYEALSKRSWSLPRMLGSYSSDLRRVAELQVDSAILFEGVNNTLKLLGDQYLARVYRLVNKRFHLAEWDAGIIRKLQTLESIYEKISDQVTNRRMEMLEWVIIVLIAASIGLELIRRAP
jgi:hypothetical protein